MKPKILLAALLFVLTACAPAVTPVPTATPVPTPTLIPTPTPKLPSGSIYWTFQTEGAIWGTPTIGDGIVYIGSDDKNLYALNATTGELIWKFPTGALVRSTPAVAEGLVYFSSDDGFVYAVNAQDGQQVWRTDVANVAKREVFDQKARVFDYLQSSPTLADGWLYIGSADGNVYALDAKTGEIHWRFKTKDLVRATPTVDKGTVYIGSWDGDVYALDAQTGELRWQSSIASDTMPYYLYRPVQSKALIADGLVFDASRKASVVALDEKTGEIKWEYSYGMALWVESSPRLVGDTIYIGSSGSQNLYLLDKQTGKLLGGLNTGTFNWGTPLILNDTLYIGGAVYKDPRERGGLLAYEIKDNSKLMEKWRVPVATTLDPGAVWSGVASSPIEANGVIYFGALDGKIYVVAP